jgi:hypothetical protein
LRLIAEIVAAGKWEVKNKNGGPFLRQGWRRPARHTQNATVARGLLNFSSYDFRLSTAILTAGWRSLALSGAQIAKARQASPP